MKGYDVVEFPLMAMREVRVDPVDLYGKPANNKVKLDVKIVFVRKILEPGQTRWSDSYDFDTYNRPDTTDSRIAITDHSTATLVSLPEGFQVKPGFLRALKVSIKQEAHPTRLEVGHYSSSTLKTDYWFDLKAPMQRRQRVALFILDSNCEAKVNMHDSTEPKANAAGSVSYAHSPL